MYKLVLIKIVSVIVISCASHKEETGSTKRYGSSMSQNSSTHIKDVPYYLQGDNKKLPGSTCGNTSIAMIASHAKGYKISPDYLTDKYGKRAGQDPASAAGMLKSEGFNARHTTSGSLQKIKSLIKRGIPMVINTWMGKNGHIVVITGFDSNGFYINDPAGKWNGGYRSSSYNGWDRIPHKHYSYKKMDESIRGEDGDVYLTWIEE